MEFIDTDFIIKLAKQINGKFQKLLDQNTLYKVLKVFLNII